MPDNDGKGTQPEAGNQPSDPDGKYSKEILALKEKMPDEFQRIADYFIGVGKSEQRKAGSSDMDTLKKEREKLLQDLRTVESNYTGAEKEREQLRGRIRELEEAGMTASQIAERRAKEQSENFERQLAEAKKAHDDSKRWRASYEDLMIETKILNASTQDKTKAFNPKQVVNLLRPHAKVEPVVEEIDGKYRETGQFKVVLNLYDDKGGMNRDFPFEDGWKVWSENRENDNLFQARMGSGSEDGTTKYLRTQTDIPLSVLNDPASYRKHREKLLQKLQ